ncbi:MAG: pirin family protein, partial [Saprospiraceae bacterium]
MNTTVKSVENIFNPPPVHMVGDGFRVHNFIPGIPQLSMQRMDPFIMLDYNSRYYFPPTDQPRGVGVHPHRGFETVTIAYHGRISHHDSHGHAGTIGEGEVQWMTAAGGVLHKEYHEREFSKLGGDFQMVQLWVNLPAANKMDTPGYQSITRDNICQIKLDSARIELIAGRFREWTGPARTRSEINMANVMMDAGARLTLEYPSTFTTCLLIIEGEIAVNDTHKAIA